MKADARRIRAALGRPGDIRLFLLHGPDAAGAAELAGLLAHTMGPDVERVELDGTMLARDPARLADEAASPSLFGSARFLRVSGVGDESVAAIETLLAAPRTLYPTVAIAPAARTTSRLVKLAIAAPDALAHACYEPSAENAERIAATMAQDAGLIPQPGVARRLAMAAGNDRAVMAREIEKLALYLDARTEMPQRLDHEALEAIGADLGESEATRLVAAIVEGRPGEVGTELGLLDAAGGSPVTWLRALARRLVVLAEIRGDIDAGRAPDAAMKRHRVFRDEAATERLARRWSSTMLAKALARTQAAERAGTAAATAGGIVAAQAALAMAHAVARD